MSKVYRSSHSTRVPLARLARRPLYRSVAFWAATLSFTGTVVLEQPAFAAGQSSNPPTPITGPISVINTGSNGADQSGGAGGDESDLNYQLGSGITVGSSNGGPSIWISSQGGTGGTGQDGGDPTGNGGTGGNPGNITLTLADSSVVDSSTAGQTPNAAIWLNSTGGDGGTAGKMSASLGRPGMPGAGQGARSVTLNQYGSVTSHAGWSGSNSGTAAILLTANGGNAAQPLASDGAEGAGAMTGAAGNIGGYGGPINYNLFSGNVESEGSAIVALSNGGQGGDGTSSYSAGKGQGGAGGAGGNGGQITINIEPTSGTPTITAKGAPTAATGATVPIDANGDTAQASVMAAGIQALSQGGLGGSGGTGSGGSSYGGAGGQAGDANTVSVTIDQANISTTGFAAAGVLAQSIGGAGGNGGGADGMFSKKGGNGAAGGAGAAVTMALGNASSTSGMPVDLISTIGADSMGLVAQSIGGGGGAGGSVSGGSVGGGVSIGGDGEGGGAAGTVTFTNGTLASANAPAQTGFVVSTTGEHSSALVAQSIGGGGGTGGTASSVQAGIFDYTVGGSGGTGGAAGTVGNTQVTLVNNGIVSTTGDHAKGMVAQVVGGGGGDGGSAQTLSGSALLNVDITVGGSGGKSGTAGDVVATNTGQVLTSGADAWGMLAQSVSDGGGNGGSSKSDIFTLSGAGDAPSLSINASIGGNGGDGSASGNVTASNQYVIMTGGAAAHGILAQSVAGGGGNGGDSSALTVGGGVGQGSSTQVTVAVGGQGGEGGSGGNVTVDNSASAMIWTLGNSADGIFAQSVGGGGGSGASGTSNGYFVGQSSTKSDYTFKLGSDGAGGSTGGAVTVTNEGGILTMGDGGNGIFAQSIGGGGGVATGGLAKGSAGGQNETITLSGSSSSHAVFLSQQGAGGTVAATNNGTIYTLGGDAAGLYAQSVGGGGGKGGSGATAGLPSSSGSLPDYLAATTGIGGSLQTYPGGILGFKQAFTQLEQLYTASDDYLAYASSHQTSTPADASGALVQSNLYVGGASDGSGSEGNNSVLGDGGDVIASNNATIQTDGAASAGMFAQSVGAGGGHAGSTLVNQQKATTGNTATVNVVVGGGAMYNLGNGGDIDATNVGTIQTNGDAAFGMFAQSVGAGGGEAVVTASNYAASNGKAPLSISLGGFYGSTGDGGIINVFVDPNNTQGGGSIETSGNDAVGVVAQSIGGGGGNVVVLQTAATDDNVAGLSKSVSSPLSDNGNLASVTVGSSALVYTLNPVTICSTGAGYAYNSCGSGGAVTVNTGSGNLINTTGRDAHAILAQSIGGGGGWITGINPSNVDPFNQPIMAGNGGDVMVNTNGNILTTGDGAYGVLAQSVGGGGVLAGDLAGGGGNSITRINFPHVFNGGGGDSRDGTGGNVTVDNSGVIATTGAFAHAVFAQSVGGGGGLYAIEGGTAVMGYTGGKGSAGSIEINNSGQITASGNGASAIFTNSQGQSNASAVTIANQVKGRITGNSSAPTITFTGGNTNGDGSIVNDGTITNLEGVAVSAPDGFAVINNTAGSGYTGTITGDVRIGAKGTFDNGGVWNMNSSSVVGTVNNYGTINVYGLHSENYVPSQLDGTLNNAGRIRTNMDFYQQQSSYLQTTGNVAFSTNSYLEVNPSTLVPNVNVPVIYAPSFSGMGSPPVTDLGNNFLFNYTATINYGEMSVLANPGSNFLSTATASGATSNQQSTAKALDSTWQGGSISQGQAKMFAAYSQVANGPEYLNALNTLGSEGSQAASVAHVVASTAFVERMNSCPRFEEGSMFQREHDCVWGRVIANSTDRDSAGDSVGYHQNGQVLQMGGQREVADDWFVGGSVSSDHSSLSTTAISDHLTGHGWTAGVIAKHQMGDWLASVALEGGEMTYGSTRQAVLGDLGGTARASFDVAHMGLHGRVSRQFTFDHWYLKPYMDLHATHIDSDGYTEQGAGALDLRASAEHDNIFSASPMMEAGSHFDFSNGMMLQVYAGLGASFYNQGSMGSNMQLADGPGPVYFRSTSDLPQDRVQATAGMDLKANDHWDARLEYSGQFASHFQSNTGALKVTYKF